MLRDHWLRSIWNEWPDIHEDLLVAEHPVSIDQEQKRGKSEHINAILSELIIQSCWLLHVTSNNESLNHVLVEIVNCCDWEKSRQSNTIHHCNESNVEHVRVLEMDNVVFSTVKNLKVSHWCLFLSCMGSLNHHLFLRINHGITVVVASPTKGMINALINIVWTIFAPTSSYQAGP